MKKHLPILIFAIFFLTACNGGGTAEPEEVIYASTSPKVCENLRFKCDVNDEKFSDETGCGCKKNKADKNTEIDDPSRNYLSTDAKACKTMKFFCDASSKPFRDSTGCGCRDLASGESPDTPTSPDTSNLPKAK